MAHYLLPEWPRLAEEIRTRKIALFLDYDGTLTPIVPTPAQAKLSLPLKRQLTRLSEKLPGRIAVISGRQLADIKKKVNVPAIVYVGNHGLEIKGPGLNFNRVIAQGFSKEIRKLRELLRQKLQHIKGILLEDKRVALGVHYRLVTKSDILKVKKICSETLKPYIHAKKVKVIAGKKVLEVRPPVNWHKGKAVLWLLRKFRAQSKNIVAVYIGDDKTDEEAFNVLKAGALTVFVGSTHRTQARYYLKNTAEVNVFLGYLYTLLKGRDRCPKMK